MSREVSYRRPRVSARRHPAYDERVPRPASLCTAPFRPRSSDKPPTEVQPFEFNRIDDVPALHGTVFVPSASEKRPTVPQPFLLRTSSPRGMPRERIRSHRAPWKPHKSDKEPTVTVPFALSGTEHAQAVPVPEVLLRRPFTPVPCDTPPTRVQPFPFETAYLPPPIV